MKKTITYLLMTVVASSLLAGAGCASDGEGPRPSERLSQRDDGKNKVDVANLKGGDIYQ